MKSLLYIGNKLSGHGLNQTSIETLGNFLGKERYAVFFSSSKKNQVLRLLDMCCAVILKCRKVNYVIIDTYSTSSFWYAFTTSQLCRILKLRYVTILRGGDLPNRLKNNPKFCRLLFENAHKNVAPSHYLLHEFENAGYKNLVFIPNSIEMEHYPFKERKGLQPKLLWVRAFADIYNPKMAVDVLKLVQENYPAAELCMVGPDKDGSGVLTQDYANSLGLNVRFTGRMSKEEWIALSKDYDIFINTTHFDNTPVSVMEAMALGLPVVTTNVGGIPFLLNDNEDAFLVNDNDTEAMVKAIQYLIENPRISSNIANNARAKAERWDWNTVKEQWKKLLV